MTQRQLRVAVIIGSVRDGRFGPVVSRWFAQQAEGHGDFEVDVIDLAEADLSMVLPAFGATPAPETLAAVQSVSTRLAEADAFVVVTPEYNHSYPASLKNVIDWHNAQWHAKPVAFVAYGGLSGGLRAVEHLRQVFAELHAVTVRDTVSFHGAWSQFDDEGNPKDPDAVNAAAKTMLDQLGWWSLALREARDKRPYRT
ncbi:NAD(P)H-dependent oxidoreductase [Kitasatospora paranensis]|uniref:NADPH-dependent FMN reductase n=1 Tax=Kitasatospora paranensis TaxID=258053 RepID=A0ABW2FSS1_9ACTN